MNTRRKKRIVFDCLLVTGLVFSVWATRFSQFIETYYSTAIYYLTIRPYSLLTGVFPFSLAEVIVVVTAVFVFFTLLRGLVTLFRNPAVFVSSIPAKVLRLVRPAAVLLLLFNLMWGLNYSRLTFAQISGLPVEPASVSELAGLARRLTHRANDLRELTNEDDRGVMTLPAGVRDMFNRAYLGYEKAAQIYPELGGRHGRPKGVFLSRYWSYTGIGGVYFPFTAEANVNIDMPHFMLPSAATHEMAHQRGFAREDEANYIAYLTSILHPDPDFQYSGVILALIYAMNQLHRCDTEIWREIRDEFSAGVRRDLQEWREYRERYEGVVNQISNNVNDAYLRANRQGDGVHSYGRMVDLLLAEFRLANARATVR